MFGLLAILGACREEEVSGPEKLAVTAANMEGTWIWQAEGEATIEVMKFTVDGEFFFTDRLEEASFEDMVAGTYKLIKSSASVTAIQKDTELDFTVTSLTANEMTIRHKSGATATYSRLITTLEISHNMSFKPDYGLYLSGNVSSFRSRNDKTASVDKSGTITGKSEGITLIDVVTDGGTAVVLVKVDGLIYDYTQAIGLTKEEVCKAYGSTPFVTEEAVIYNTDEKMTTYRINKRTKVVDAINIVYSKKGFSNTALVDYLSNKYYVYKAETGGTFYAFINASTYDTSNVKIIFNGTTNQLTYTYINHDLFEDFSIALGKTRNEVVYMYGDDLECITNKVDFVKYAIGDEVQGYPGTDIMEEVTFRFYDGMTTSVELRLHNQLNPETVTSFLKSRYSYSHDNSTNRHQYYYDRARKLVIDYIPEDCEICYYFEE